MRVLKKGDTIPLDPLKQGLLKCFNSLLGGRSGCK